MKKLTIMAVSLALALGTFAFAQDSAGTMDKKEDKMEKKAKKKKAKKTADKAEDKKM